MATKNLWGTLPAPESAKTPAQILKEQASYLTEMSKGVLVGEVADVTATYAFSYALMIRAPALNNYRVTLLIIGYNIGMYPVSIDDKITSAPNPTCQNEEDFIEKLGKILGSQEAQRIIGALLTHSNAEK